MTASPTRVARRFLASYQSEVGSLPLATVVGHQIGGQFGRTLHYIKTHKGWQQFQSRGEFRGHPVGDILDKRIPESTLKEAYDEGTLGLAVEGVEKGSIVRGSFQLDAMKPGSVVEEPSFTPLVKLPNGQWAGGDVRGGDQPTNSGADSQYMVGILQDSRAKWVK